MPFGIIIRNRRAVLVDPSTRQSIRRIGQSDAVLASADEHFAVVAYERIGTYLHTIEGRRIRRLSAETAANISFNGGIVTLSFLDRSWESYSTTKYRGHAGEATRPSLAEKLAPLLTEAKQIGSP